VRKKQVLVIDLLIFQLVGHSKHISFQHEKIYAQFVYSIFRGSFGAAKFHTRVLSIILRRIFVEFGQKLPKELLRPFVLVDDEF
jgi:hypothetical protein